MGAPLPLRWLETHPSVKVLLLNLPAVDVAAVLDNSHRQLVGAGKVETPRPRRPDVVAHYSHPV